MLKGKTKSGFEFDISDDRLNNYELVEVLAELDENALLLPKLLTMLLAAKQKEALIEHLRQADGIVPLDRIKEEVEEIFRSGIKAKNSSSLPE